jgi:glutathione synthase
MPGVNDVFSTYPPDVPDDKLEYLVSTVKNWTIQHGLTVRPSPATVTDEVNPNHVLATNAPVALFPSPFPKTCFERARSLQTVYNELYAAIASNERWLETIMKE